VSELRERGERQSGATGLEQIAAISVKRIRAHLISS
jgi:hypothetical protein